MIDIALKNRKKEIIVSFEILQASVFFGGILEKKKQKKNIFVVKQKYFMVSKT